MIPEPINVLEKYLKKKLHDVGLGDDFLDVTLKAQATETEINTWDYIKLKSFCTQRKRQSERQPTE